MNSTCADSFQKKYGKIYKIYYGDYPMRRKQLSFIEKSSFELHCRSCAKNLTNKIDKTFSPSRKMIIGVSF